MREGERKGREPLPMHARTRSEHRTRAHVLRTAASPHARARPLPRLPRHRHTSSRTGPLEKENKPRTVPLPACSSVPAHPQARAQEDEHKPTTEKRPTVSMGVPPHERHAARHAETTQRKTGVKAARGQTPHPSSSLVPHVAACGPENM